ncbi:hypothetical protein [Nocardiopsis sp. JB363]|nr:hypothetical protein [Nocardiopsis sp. JB363]
MCIAAEFDVRGSVVRARTSLRLPELTESPGRSRQRVRSSVSSR